MASYEVTVGPKPVSTKGSTSSVMTVPMTAALAGRRVKSVRPSVFVDSSSGNFQLKVGYQTSNDGTTWSATSHFTNFNSWISASGWTRGTVFDTATAAPYHRIVVEAENSSGTDMECARITVLLEIRFS